MTERHVFALLFLKNAESKCNLEDPGFQQQLLGKSYPVLAQLHQSSDAALHCANMLMWCISLVTTDSTQEASWATDVAALDLSI